MIHSFSLFCKRALSALTLPATLALGTLWSSGLAHAATQTKIVFVSDRSGLISLWTSDSNGANPALLLSGATDPALSPIGDRLAFVKNGDIFIAKISIDAGTVTLKGLDDSANPTVLATKTSTGFAAPAFSPTNGAEVVFESGTSPNKNISIVKSDGSEANAVRSAYALTGNDTSPRFVTESQIVFARTGSNTPSTSSRSLVTLMLTQGANIVVEQDGSLGDINRLDVSPTTTTNGVIYSRLGGPTFGLYRKTLGAGSTTTSPSIPGSVRGDDFPSFSPDGTQIVFSSTATSRGAASGLGEIFIASSTGTIAPVNVSNNSANDYAPVIGNIPVVGAAPDNAPPTVLSITRSATNPTTASSAGFLITFSEPVTGVNVSDFAIATTGNLSGATVSSVTGSGATYTVTVSGLSGTGTLRLNLLDDDSIMDSAANRLGGTGTGNGNFNLGETYTRNDSTVTAMTPATSGAIISEFRLRGTGGSGDEYVELLNKGIAPLNIGGWSIKTNTGTLAAPVFQSTVVPQNTFIPAFGHLLFTGGGYSLGGVGAGDALMGGDAADASGVALFNAAATVQDAVGFAGSDTTLKEGAGLPNYPTANGEYTFMRDFVVSQSKDTGDSTNDFVFVSTTGAGVAGTPSTVAAQLGAPSPEGLTSPSYSNHLVINTLLDPSVGSAVSPNRDRITGGGAFGTLIVRRTIKNNTSVPIKRMRFGVTSITSLNSAGSGASQADVRLVSAPQETVTLANGTTSVQVLGTTLEAGGANQPAAPVGGGLGSSLNFADVTLTTPLLPGQSRNFAFRLQIEKGGSYYIALNILALTQ